MLEYGLPAIAVGYAVAMIGFLAYRKRQLDKAQADILAREADAKSAALEAASKQPDISNQIAHASRTASIVIASGAYMPRGRSLANKRAASYRQHA